MYSDFGSTRAMLIAELVNALNIAKETEPGYEALIRKVYIGEYDHNRAAKRVTDAAPFNTKTFVLGVTENNTPTKII